MALFSLLLSSGWYNGIDVLVILVLEEAYLTITKAFYILAFLHWVEGATLERLNQLEFLSFEVSYTINWLDYIGLFLSLGIP